ncbi:MAG: hypothetical protein AB8H12_24335 [Lewinella sp.]
MTTDSVLEILDALRCSVDPRTGESFRKADSCLGDPTVRSALNRLISTLAVPDAPVEVDISDAIINKACAGLRELGYQPCVVQLVKVFIGSRSIADRSLKGLRAYNMYRGKYTRPVIHAHLIDFHRRFPEVLSEHPAPRQATVHEPWREIDFFQTESFDKLDETKFDELKAAVRALGLRKPDDRLPAYMATARANYPRAYEPWVRDEQALLIEAMCYTNDLTKLAPLFGRTVKSIEGMGQRLIFESKKRQVKVQ